MLTIRGLDRVLSDLAGMGFDARWGVLGAADVGANHQRDRIWIVAKWSGQLSHAQLHRVGRWEQQQESIKKEDGKMADSTIKGLQGQQRQEHERSRIRFAYSSKKMANTDNERLQGSKRIRNNNKKIIGGFEGAHGSITECNSTYGTETNWWNVEPNVGRVANGVAARVDRLKAIGNGQVPLCAATAWRILNPRQTEGESL
jgi:DNA (cytosine-5)-methyltransferase 1